MRHILSILLLLTACDGSTAPLDAPGLAPRDVPGEEPSDAPPPDGSFAGEDVPRSALPDAGDPATRIRPFADSSPWNTPFPPMPPGTTRRSST